MTSATTRQLLNGAMGLFLASTMMMACSNDNQGQREKEDTHTATPDTASHMGDTATYEQMPLKTNDSLPK